MWRELLPKECGSTESPSFDKFKANGCGNSDAVALNIGSSSWQLTQLDYAYTAAEASGTPLKMFISFDFTEMSCDLGTIVNMINTFKRRVGQFKVNGKPMVSSYSGDCLQNSGWQSLKDPTVSSCALRKRRKSL